MYKNIIEVKKNINSLKWGREERVTDTISRRRLINDGAKGYSYKYYMNSNPKDYVVMSSGEQSYVGNNITADAVAFGVKNGVATKLEDYLNDNYNHRENYFRDALLDKLGNTAVKDFKLNFKRRMGKKTEMTDKYNKVLKKEFIENLQPKLIKAAKDKEITLNEKSFGLSYRTGALFPDIHFKLNGYPVVVMPDPGKAAKYYGYLEVDPRTITDKQEEARLNYYDKILQNVLIKIINDTSKERTSKLMSDRNGRVLRTIIKGSEETKEKEEKMARGYGYRSKEGSINRLRYEEYIPNYFPY